MSHRFRRPALFLFALIGLAVTATVYRVIADEYKSGKVWPEPKVVDPGPPGGPPSDAIVLFGGQNLDEWNGGDKWLVADGVTTINGGGISTKRSFGSCQLHAEWAAPAEVKGKGQGRGNSGIFLQSQYEIQILDSYDNETYFDGQAASVYKQTPPLVNACRKPGEWQTYDIIYQAPEFDADKKLVKPAYVTVLHNGVLVLNHFQIEGSTAWDRPPSYSAHAAKLPISIQNHGKSGSRISGFESCDTVVTVHGSFAEFVIRKMFGGSSPARHTLPV